MATLRNKIQALNDEYVLNKLNGFNHSILDVEIESKSNKDFCADINKIEASDEIKFILATLLVK